MGLQERRSAVQALQDNRNHPLLAYVTSRRENLPAFVSHDAIPIIYEHLLRLIPNPPADQLDVLVITFGGDTTVPLVLQNVMREFARKVCVLVPAECLSAGTMIALGANEIVMGRLGQLSPIDPSLTHPLNPQSPIVQTLATGQPGNPLVPIEVEQVFSYLSLARDKAKLKSPDAAIRVFESLVQKVHPIALGEIHRTHSLIRKLAEELLKLHMGDRRAIAAIIEALTEKLYSHSYRISRRQAELNLKLPVVHAETNTESLMMQLRQVYVTDGQMDVPHNAQVEIQDAVDAATAAAAAAPKPAAIFPLELRYQRVFIGSVTGDSVWVHRRRITQSAPVPIQMPGVVTAGSMNYNGRDTFRWETTWA